MKNKTGTSGTGLVERRRDTHRPATAETKNEDSKNCKDIRVPSVCKQDELPEDHHFLLDGGAQIHIKRGYRIHHSSIKHACSSFFVLHNETVNVHTHFWTAIIFIMFMIRTFYFLPDFAQTADWVDVLIFSICSACLLFCFFASSVYHLFNCCSHSAYCMTEKVDFGGVMAFLGSATVGCAYYGLWCWPDLQYSYTLITLTMLFASLPIVITSPRKEVRLAVFLITGIFGPFICLHWVATAGLFTLDVIDVLPRIVMLWLILSVALYFYLSKFPETHFPEFDLVGASHQIWHLFISLGAFWEYSLMLYVYHMRKSTTCEDRHSANDPTLLWNLLFPESS